MGVGPWSRALAVCALIWRQSPREAASLSVGLGHGQAPTAQAAGLSVSKDLPRATSSWKELKEAVRPRNRLRNLCSASDSVCGPQSSCLQSRSSSRLLSGVLRAFSGPCHDASPESLTRLITPFYLQAQDPSKEAVPWGGAWGTKRSKKKRENNKTGRKRDSDHHHFTTGEVCVPCTER